MNKSTAFFSIVIYAFAFSIIGITSVYLGSKILILTKSDITKLIFNSPVATIIAVILFAFWEKIIKKSDETLIIKDINHMVYSIFLSFIIMILLFAFVIDKSFSSRPLKWRIMEFLFILIPINTIILLIKIYYLKVRKNEKDT